MTQDHNYIFGSNSNFYRSRIFGMVGDLDHISVKFEYQDNWLKVKVTLVKWAVWTVGYQIISYDQLMVLI